MAARSERGLLVLFRPGKPPAGVRTVVCPPGFVFERDFEYLETEEWKKRIRLQTTRRGKKKPHPGNTERSYVYRFAGLGICSRVEFDRINVELESVDV